MYPIKKVMTIHDMSCYGRASLTSIIPIISTMGIQVCPLPTAVLSTHTGGYGKPMIEDLSDFMWGAKSHWKKLELEFEAIYTGYLANVAQVKIVSSIISEFKKEGQLIVIDPVMGDEGAFYCSFGDEMVEAMRSFIKNATIITPNITELALLLNESYEDRFDFDKVDNWTKSVSELGIENIIVTSAPSRKGEKFIDTIVYSKVSGKLSRISVEKVNMYYPGTGDAFTSVVIGKILNGETIENSSIFASEFVSKAIKISNSYDYDYKEGILLEKVLGMLTK